MCLEQWMKASATLTWTQNSGCRPGAVSTGIRGWRARNSCAPTSRAEPLTCSPMWWWVKSTNSSPRCGFSVMFPALAMTPFPRYSG